jgi:hypothetical protein
MVGRDRREREFWMGSMRRALAAGCAVLALFALPAAASATVWEGKALDPQGDSSGAPAQDIVRAAISYDSDGELYATATMGGTVGATPRTLFKVAVASFTAPDQCGGPGVELKAFSDAGWTTTSLGIGTEIERIGPWIALGAYGLPLRNRTYSCLTLTVSDVSGAVLDTLDVPVFADGLGPDGDGDGVADNIDQCATVAGVAPTGCPRDSDGDTVPDAADQCPGILGVAPTGCPASAPLPGPPGTVTTLPAEPKPAVCSTVSVKGKSLAAARKALAKAHCRLGKVTKPRKVRKGAKLVVVKQSGKNPVAITLAAAKR